MKTLTFIQFLLIGLVSAGMMAACSSDEAPQPESEAGPTTTSARETSATEANTLTPQEEEEGDSLDRKSTRLNSSHVAISYAVCCLKTKKGHGTSLRRQRAVEPENRTRTH